MKWHQILLLAGLSTALLSLRVTAEPVPLISLRPSKVFSYYPSQNASPQLKTVAIHPGEVPERGFRFITESEVSFAVPPGEPGLSGILVYRPELSRAGAGEVEPYVPILVRIMADEKILLEQAMDGTTPPIEFSISVSGHSRVTLQSEGTSVTAFYLARTEFGQIKLQQGSNYLPATAQGYVDSAPEPRQAVLGIYRPGESVAVTSYFAGSATQAVVDIHLRPTGNNGKLFERHFDVSLKAMHPGLVRGSATWTVPAVQGPASLHVKETVNGRVVFDRQLRVGIGPIAKLSTISDSDFGIHLSGAGYPFLYDEFAGLWGAKWARLFLRWPVVETSRGHYDFSRIDALLKIYHSQDMRVLLVLGENAPEWAGAPGPDYYAAWKSFVVAAVQHLVGKVDAWDIFNEVDAKYYDVMRKFEQDWDLTALRIALDAIRSTDPHTKTVCCSTVTTQWLSYDKRLFQSSLLSAIDAVSLHPYQRGAPEEKDGAFNYRERLDALRSMIRSYGVSKPIWATEANWIIGPDAAPTVLDRGLTEEEQAEYIVRANMLSAAEKVKYFVHSPYAHRYRPQIHVATWAAYSEMTFLFSNATHTDLNLAGPNVYGVTASTASGQVGALWTVKGAATIRLATGSYRFLDMYGNPVQMDFQEVHVSKAPLYFVTTIAAPQPQILSEGSAPEWRSLASLSSWSCGTHTTCTPVADGWHVQSPPSKGAFQLVSPPLATRPESCQLASVTLVLEKGAVGFYATDASTGKLLDHVVYASYVPDGLPHTIELRFHTESSTESSKLVLANANFNESQSVFTVLDGPQLADCR